MKSITEESNLENKRVLLRLDLNVPIKDQVIQDETRILKILPVINFLIEKKAKIIIISHVGRPKGKINKILSLKPICENLEEKIKRKITLLNDNIFKLKKEDLFKDTNAQIVFLENIRFYEGEEGFYDVCQRSLDKAENEILFLGSSEDFHTVATKEYNKNYYVPERMKKGIKIKMLVFNSPEAMELKEGDKDSMRETRFLPNDFFFRSTVFIYGNEFSMITSKVPFLGVVIQSKELSNCMSGMFNTLWHFVAE